MKIFVWIPALILFFSCSQKIKKPNVLSERKMTAVMWDMVRADQYVADFVSKDSSRNKKDESTKLYEQIFHIHKITRRQFKTSLDYYSSQPDLFRPIIDSLAKRKTEIMPPTNTHTIPDSILKTKTGFMPPASTHTIPDSLARPPFRKRPKKQ